MLSQVQEAMYRLLTDSDVSSLAGEVDTWLEGLLVTWHHPHTVGGV